VLRKVFGLKGDEVIGQGEDYEGVVISP